jgi:hypothetical protein
MKPIVMAALACLLVSSAAPGQTKKGTKRVTNEIRIHADAVYAGFLELAVEEGKVTGDMRIMSPTVITGKVSGTANDGMLNLEFPFQNSGSNCSGIVRMNIRLLPTPGVGRGTMEAVGCGRTEANKLTGSVEMSPRGLKRP